jgi:hypothetical protein
MRVPRPTSDLERQLEEQIDFLLASAVRYDSVVMTEAKRMAQSVRILVHDKDLSKSLLNQLGRLSESFCDTALRNPIAMQPRHHAALVGAATADGQARAVPFLDGARDVRWVPFSEWWNRTVLVDGQANSFTRNTLVLAVANQDGGAHIDPELKQDYWALTRGGSMHWSSFVNGTPVEGVALATVRQIGHELLSTLNPNYSCYPKVMPNEWMFSGGQLIHA